MAAEPTLGGRIDAMFQHYIRDDFAAPESREALIAYADAAERLAMACVRVEHEDVRNADEREYEDAYAALRAITGEVQP